MPTEHPAEAVNFIQIGIGVAALVAILVAFARTGRLRRAFLFPPLAVNTLDATHVFGVAMLFILGTQVMARLAGELVGMSPTATAPVEGAPPPGVAITKAGLAAQALMELGLIGVILWIARATFAGGWTGFGLRTDHLGRDLFWAVAGYIAAWPAILFVAFSTMWLLERLLPSWQQPEHGVVLFLTGEEVSVYWQVLAWTVAALIAPVFEELFFRGLLLTWLRDMTESPWTAIVISGAMFGLIHAPQYHLAPALCLLGAIVGYLYVRTRCLMLPILLHIVFNLRTLILVSIFGPEA